MRNTLFLLIALLVSCTSLLAQPEVSLSNGFEEPKGGWNKILQLSNGNTFRFHLGEDELEVYVYDKMHKETSKQHVKGDWVAKKIQQITVNGLYEIKGEPVIFVTRFEKRVHNLYRLRFDPLNGKLLEEKIIGTTDKYTMGSGYAVAFGNVDLNGFFVEKDPNSDYYAVIMYNSMAHETSKRINATHYSGTHQEISKVDFGSPGNFKYTKYIAMAVSEKYIITASYGYNTEASGGKDSRIIISRLKAADNEFAHELLEFSDDFKQTTGIMQYNPGNNKVQLLTNTFVKSKNKLRIVSNKTENYYYSVLCLIDPESLSVTDIKPLEFNKTSDYIKNNMNPKDAQWRTPQNMFINNDHSTTIVTEAITVEEYTSQGRTGGVYRTSYDSRLDHIGISELNVEGEEIKGTAIPKSQEGTGLIDAFYQSKKSKGMWGANLADHEQPILNEFYSFDYISTDHGRYILFNDLPENFSKGLKEERKRVGAISESHTVCYTLGSDAHKKFLFGAPEKSNNTFLYIQSSHFLKSTNTYAVIIVEKEGRKKTSKVAWLTFNSWQ